jgi:hypothetical protein
MRRGPRETPQAASYGGFCCTANKKSQRIFKTHEKARDARHRVLVSQSCFFGSRQGGSAATRPFHLF